MKSSRRRSREFAVQGLYQWLLAGSEGHELFSGGSGNDGLNSRRQLICECGHLGSLPVYLRYERAILG